MGFDKSDLPLVVESSKDTMNSSKKCRNGCLVITVVMCVLTCLVCIGLFLHALSIFNETSANLRKEFSKLRQECISETFSSTEDDEEDEEDVNETSDYHRRTKRNTKLSVQPFVHLTGMNTKHLITEGNVTYFPWNITEDHPGMHGFELMGDHDKGRHKIRVKNPGVYIVYSQVTIHGRENVNQPHECSHETVCHRKGKTEEIVLLSSLATQYQLGAPYQGNDHNQWLRALDTKAHLGVFHLHRDDELSVRVPKHCGNMEYSLTDLQNYFGVAELSHKWETGPREPKPTKKPRNGDKKKNNLKKPVQ